MDLLGAKFGEVMGLAGAVILIVGALLPDKSGVHPRKILKNWHFFVGGIFMLNYSIINFLNGGPVFFVFLQVLVNISSAMMMMKTSDSLDLYVIGGGGFLLSLLSLFNFQGIETFIFILGLVFAGIGYTLNKTLFLRNFVLALGSIFISIYSYIQMDFIFFRLNVFFALFSGLYALKYFKAAKESGSAHLHSRA